MLIYFAILTYGRRHSITQDQMDHATMKDWLQYVAADGAEKQKWFSYSQTSSFTLLDQDTRAGL